MFPNNLFLSNIFLKRDIGFTVPLGAEQAKDLQLSVDQSQQAYSVDLSRENFGGNWCAAWGLACLSAEVHF